MCVFYFFRKQNRDEESEEGRDACGCEVDVVDQSTRQRKIMNKNTRK